MVEAGAGDSFLATAGLAAPGFAAAVLAAEDFLAVLGTALALAFFVTLFGAAFFFFMGRTLTQPAPAGQGLGPLRAGRGGAAGARRRSTRAHEFSRDWP